MKTLDDELPPYPNPKDKDFLGKVRVYEEAIRAREELQDEIAYARLLARRGLKLDESWPLEVDDPRRKAWRDVLWREVAEREPFVDFNVEKNRTPENARHLHARFKRLHEILVLLNEEYLKAP